jgi:hypothetical protein
LVSIATKRISLGGALLGEIHKLKISVTKKKYVALTAIIQTPPKFAVS